MNEACQLAVHAYVREFDAPRVCTLVLFIPTSVAMCRKLLKTDGELFTKYCSAICTLEDAVERVGSLTSPKPCSYIAYPHNPHDELCRQCGAFLMKEVQMGSKTFFSPFKTFCYRSIVESLHKLCCRTDSLEKCEQWRQRKIEENILFDGQVWKDFSSTHNHPI